MIDEREIVRRAVERIAPPEPSFERLLRRRDRRRRNERLAAGVAGTAVAVVAALAFLSAIVDDGSRTVGTDPSPTLPAEPTITFTSPLYGYTLTYPGGWTAVGASRPWTSRPLSRGVADVLSGVETEGALLEAGSIEIPETMTTDEWLDREERRAVVGLGGAGFAFVPTTVGGVPGRLSVGCGVLLAVDDRRGYVFRLYGDITVNTDLRAVVRSIELQPEDA